MGDLWVQKVAFELPMWAIVLKNYSHTLYVVLLIFISGEGKLRSARGGSGRSVATG